MGKSLAAQAVSALLTMKRFCKEQLLSIVLLAYISVTRFMRTLRNIISESSALLLPPYSPGSLGDEAILTSATEEMKRRGIDKLYLISYRSDDNWDYLRPVAETINMENYFSAGSWKDRFRFVRAAGRCAHFYAFGTDVMDGFYDELTLKRIALVALAAKTGARATIVSFSFNDHPTPESVKALRALPLSVRLCSRDPISRDRLVRHLVRPVELVADVAFLLRPAADSELVASTLSWVRAQRAAHRTVIGINVNHLLLRQVAGLEPEKLVQIHASAMAEVFSRCSDVSFLLVPHDIRGAVSDVWLANATLEAIPASMKPYCQQVPTPCSASEIKAICGDLDIVLSGKMHLSIACLSQATPVACIIYQDKFEGLFKHFALDGMTIQPDTALQPGELARFFIPLIGRRENVRSQIQSRLPQIVALAHANFES
jgi:polysaccharide pyruvyl transferase WcaK-like protein